MSKTMESNHDEAREPFLKESSNTDDSDVDKTTAASIAHQQPSRQCQRSRPLISSKHVVFHIALVALYTILSALTIFALSYGSSSSHSVGSSSKYAPPYWLPEADLHPVATIIHNNVTNPLSPYIFGLGPISETDRAWSSLLSSMNMRASDDELTLNGARSTIRLNKQRPSDKGDNLVRLGVFHELHCLKTLTDYVHHRDARESGDDDEDEVQMLRQVDQCIDTLRINAMCQPDLSLTTLEWQSTTVSGKRVPVANGKNRVRECVDFEGLVKSLENRVISDEDI